MRVLRSPGAAPTVLLATLLAGLVACGGAAPVDRGTVARKIGEALVKQHVAGRDVACPSDLPAEVGRSVKCGFSVDGQPVDAVVTVRSPNGGADGGPQLEIVTEARPIARDLLARKVKEQLATQTAVRVASAVCDGDLAPTPRATQRCTVSGPDGSMTLTVTVTTVTGGRISYSIEQV
jgi:Domain of unknown function (DUF4333)